MHETHERTGATEKQIETAAELARAQRYFYPGNEAKEVTTWWCERIVPPGTVIVPEAVLTAAQAWADNYREQGGIAYGPLGLTEDIVTALDAVKKL